MQFALGAALSLAGLAQAQTTPTIAEETLHGRRAWVLSNGLIRIAVLAGGGHIAEARFLTGDPRKDVNPLRVPHYPTIEPQQYEASRHDALYGDTPHRWLSSGYMGHLLCFPIYGPPSADEARAGLGNHGEAPIVEWHKTGVDSNADQITLRYAADLPKTQFRVERSVTLARGAHAIRVEEWVENLTDFDRPINWMEHATFGPPFIEPGKTVLDVSATRGQVAGGRAGSGSLQPGSTVEWPRGTAYNGQAADLRVFQPRERSGTYVALRLDPGRAEQFFTLYHPAFRVLIGYAFPAADTPWIADWQENRSSTIPPWNGQVIARGIEWGSSPFAEGLRRSVERQSLLGAPAFQWIGGRQRLRREFTIFLAEIPEGFPGVRDVRIQNGAAVVTPR